MVLLGNDTIVFGFRDSSLRRICCCSNGAIPPKWFFLGVSSVVGGMLFPVSVLPGWLQVVAHLNPVTYALEAMRSGAAGWSERAGDCATAGDPVCVRADPVADVDAGILLGTAADKNHRDAIASLKSKAALQRQSRL